MIKGIRKFYSQISGPYELINSIITLGLDSYWRKKAVRMIVKTGPTPGRFLDICSGTGQTAVMLSRHLPSATQITAADFSLHMLKKAADKIHKKGIKNILLTLADAPNLPFEDNTFDTITISFATRNLDAAPGHLLQSFREFHRVLKPGGTFLNLETSQPPVKIIKILFHLYVKLTVAPVGKGISGSTGSYSYLSNSIRTFYPAKELSALLSDAGFAAVEYRNLLFGAAALHISKKN